MIGINALATTGRWQSILLQLGVGATYLRDKHGPCPMCGGKDRFRFPDWNGTGSFWCNSCGRGSGLDFVMAFKGVTYVEAIKLIESVVPGARLSTKRDIGPDISEKKNAMRQLWARSLDLNGADIASRYLRRRGLELQSYPPCLRWASSVAYYIERELDGYYPVLLARFVAPDDSSGNLQKTHLCEPGVKARLPDGARKTMPGPMPAGGAVRLGAAAEVMGVAEGVETALAASLLSGVPVWAVLSTAGILRFQPPPVCKRLLIFGDRDEKFAGQAAAFALAHRLETGRAPVSCQVRVPESGTDDPWLDNKRDWNDVLTAPKLRVAN